MAFVLLVDDDDLTRAAMMAALVLSGCVVAGASDGSSALASIGQAPPDIVVTDLDMPGLSGLDLCRAIRADPALQAIPIVVISSLQPTETDLAGLADFYMRKPVSAEQLVSVIAELLRARPALAARTPRALGDDTT